MWWMEHARGGNACKLRLCRKAAPRRRRLGASDNGGDLPLIAGPAISWCGRFVPAIGRIAASDQALAFDRQPEGAGMRIDAIAIGLNPPEDVNVIVEVPIGGEPIKYELDKAAGTLVVDRFLHTPMRYPGNYGFVPHTLSEDGD